jgi:3-phenylpropionate/cinnamic acid dioxygenase small subunit
MSADRDARIDALLLHNELHGFFCRYFDMNDDRRLHEMPDFYTADGQFNLFLSRADFAAGKAAIRARGSVELEAMVNGALVHLDQTHHTMGNFRIETKDGEVIARANLRAYHRGCGVALGKDEESLSAFTAYMVQKDGRWKIACFDYTLYIVLGTFDAFPDMNQQQEH